jgi:hypothetical protein
MNYQEVSAVLAKIKLGDNRQIDDKGLVLRDWFDSIGDLNYSDAIAAVVLHRRESTEYLMPAHIRVGAKRAKEAREREENRKLNVITSNRITLDRAKFEAETQAAIDAHRAAKEVRDGSSAV